MYTLLASIFNAMASLEHRPNLLKRGLIVPIPKGKKDPCNPGNSRGITLMSAVGKVYDKLLMARAKAWFDETLDELQGACKDNTSSLMTSLLLNEAIASQRDRGNEVYVCQLDAKKAFDKVWTDGLFYKLHKRGLDSKLWKILRDAYMMGSSVS